MSTTYVASRAKDDAPWHRATYKEVRGPSGKLFSAYWVPACSGRSIGGPWGSTVKTERPTHGDFCRRCFPST